jgi:hypothetical protein
MQSEIYLTIEGEPGQEVQVWYRGSQDSDLPNSSPVIFTGKLGADGRITVRVPRAYLCVGIPEKAGCKPFNFENETDENVTISFKAESSGDITSKPELSNENADDEERIKEAADHDLEARQEEASMTGEIMDKTISDDVFSVVPRPWRVAQCLLTLRNQINQRAPNRNKASDGTIGDRRHCSGSPRASDHCAWIIDGAHGVVSAMDITHDPAHGCDANALAEAIRDARDPRVKYIIWNRRIANSSPIGGQPAWAWRNYTGSNGHTHHIHISVKSDRAHYDSTTPWSI